MGDVTRVTGHPKNRLADETSPYLLQHASNPVDWYPWGPEALARAKAEDKPIFLSIGYAACHWCHVMERESFEDDATAKLMNEHFVCIKVDREERPDIDEIYMAATIAMSGGGGWPMSVFLTPEREPFFAGTYFPKSNRYGKPSFQTVLTKLAEAWKDDRDVVVEQSKELTRAVRANTATGAPGPLADALIDAFVKQCAKSFDSKWGGFGGAPKFPPAATIELLLRHGERTGDALSLTMARSTLEGMKNGGMHDHVGGGFARYSVDAEWHVPHFEKMLYDNALLAHAYVEAFQVTKDPEMRRVARATLDYVAREMQGDHGGYFSATDADSEGVEGRFFVWSLREIEDVLGDPDGTGDARRFAAFYDVSEEGNWEGHNVLRTPRHIDDVARDVGWSGTIEGFRENLEASREKLYAARAKRVHPLLDDKVLVAWNGLMIRAMAFAGRVLGQPRYVASAVRAVEMIERELRRPDGGLLRTYRAGKAHLAAYLEDYAFYADGLVDLYEATGDDAHLRRAEALVKRIVADFGGEDASAFFLTANDHEELVTRTADGADGAIPNGNAVAARALVRVGAHLGDASLADRAIAALRAHGATMARAPRAFATSLLVVDALLEAPLEIAIVGQGPGADALARVVAETFLPGAVLARTTSPSSLPLLEGKPTDAPKAFVCRGFACDAPVSEADALRGSITRARAEAASSRQSALP